MDDATLIPDRTATPSPASGVILPGLPVGKAPTVPP